MVTPSFERRSNQLRKSSLIPGSKSHPRSPRFGPLTRRTRFGTIEPAVAMTTGARVGAAVFEQELHVLIHGASLSQTVDANSYNLREVAR